MSEVETKKSDSFEVVTTSGSKTIVMTYARLLHCAKSVGDLTAVGAICVDPELQQRFISALLSKQEGFSFKSDEYEVRLEELSVDTASKLVDWGISHVSDFFIGRLPTALALKDKVETLMTDLTEKKPT